MRMALARARVVWISLGLMSAIGTSGAAQADADENVSLASRRVEGQPFVEASAKPTTTRKKIAIIANYWEGPMCHANAIGTKFLIGFPTDEGILAPEVDVASIFIAQSGAEGVGTRLAKTLNIPVYPTVAEALTLGGANLAVDGVLYVGEHGDYPRSRFGVKMYPHLSILEQVFGVFDASGRSVPVFCDKQLAYSWLDSKWIYDRARELNAPLLAGSVLPLTWRKPVIRHALNANITEAVAIGYGPLDSYGFHAMEILQSMVERRKGGETGVESIQCLAGDAVYQAAREGRFSLNLAEAACATIKDRRGVSLAEAEKNPVAILVKYRDGTKGTVMLVSRYVGEHWAYAAQVDGVTQACEFVSSPKSTLAYFSYLGLNAQKMFVTGTPPYPAERALLTSGIVDMAVRSRAGKGVEIKTPFLDITYQPASSDPVWPAASEPKGASLGPWPPPGFEFTGLEKKR